MLYCLIKTPGSLHALDMSMLGCVYVCVCVYLYGYPCQNQLKFYTSGGRTFWMVLTF